jgi:voltage-gated potassium channel Kch
MGETAMKKIQQWVYRVLFDLQSNSSLPRRLEKFVNWLIVANLLALMLEHIPAVHQGREEIFHNFDVASVIFFTVEYFSRLFAAPANPALSSKRFPRFKHVSNPFAVIDLLVIAPFWLHYAGLVELDLRALRGLRLLRLLKFLRDVVPAIQEFRIANRGKTWRQKANALMNETSTSGRLQGQLDMLLIFFIILSVVCVFLETVPQIAQPLHVEFFWIDLISIVIFSGEYLLRLYAAPEQAKNQTSTMARLTHTMKPNTIIDLIAILPFYLQFIIALDLRFIRILRVLRVTKLTRYNTAMKTFALVFEREKRAFAAALFITFLLIILSAAIVYEVEHPAQPEKFDNMFRAIYWATVTLASVGYGDISPITPIGQFFTVVLAVLGIAIVAVPAGIIGSAFTDQLHQDRSEMQREIDNALADGVISESEMNALEEERIRLHMTEEQFELLKQRALEKRGAIADPNSREALVRNTALMIEELEKKLGGVPLEEALDQIRGMAITEKQKAALRSLLN